MSDIYDEYHSAVESLSEEYGVLRILNPDHPLLPLLKDVSFGEFTITPAFDKRYRNKKPTGEGMYEEVCVIGRAFNEFRKVVTSELQERLRRLKKDLGDSLSEEKLWEKLKEEGLAGATRICITHNERPLLACID